MSILSDKQIKKLVLEKNMISPFEEKMVSNGISHGLGSYGYDTRAGTEFKVFTNINSSIADPKNFSEDNFITVNGQSVLIPPNSFALASSVDILKCPEM